MKRSGGAGADVWNAAIKRRNGEIKCGKREKSFFLEGGRYVHDEDSRGDNAA